MSTFTESGLQRLRGEREPLRITDGTGRDIGDLYLK
jgi:hypothetical protein